MVIEAFQTIDELQRDLGERLRRLRLSRNLDQLETAARAQVSEKALRNLEAGQGSNVHTLLSVLKALDALDALNALAPRTAISPLAMLERSKAPQRVRRQRKQRAIDSAG